MRDNSGSGKGNNNMRDPTMRDHEDEGRQAQQEARDATGKSAFDIGENARARDEKTSPTDRKRGETASTDTEAAVDRSH
jgi:hypothetical protein